MDAHGAPLAALHLHRKSVFFLKARGGDVNLKDEKEQSFPMLIE
jgi:hypothetical protein